MLDAHRTNFLDYIARDQYLTPDTHISYSAGVSSSEQNGEQFVVLRLENQRRHDLVYPRR